MSTFDPDALECLAAIMEEGSFDRAAQRLAITQSAVSQRLRSLEDQVGTVLLVRSRPIQATRAGQLLLKHALQTRLLRADLALELQQLTPKAGGTMADDERVAIAINADSIATWALPALDPWVQQGLGLEIITDDQDFTAEWLRQGRVLGCVTTLRTALHSCCVEPLGAMRYVAVAQPQFAARHCPQGLTRNQFSRLPFVAFNRKDDLQSEFVARAFGLTQVRLHQIYVPSTEAQVRAVLAGWGLSVLPELKVRALLEAGQLVAVLPQARFEVNLYWHCWRMASPLLQGLTTSLRAAAQAALTHPTDAGEGAN
ncbi:MAG: LysR family transcriptional regulator ArgP [Rhodoferax sp.]